MGWDGMGWDWHKLPGMEWDGTEKYVSWTSLHFTLTTSTGKQNRLRRLKNGVP